MILLLSLLGCDPIAQLGADVPDRAVVLAGVAHEVIVPTHRRLAEAAAVEAEALRALCASRDAGTLVTAQDAWLAVRRPLQEGYAFAFGPPVDDDRLLANLNFGPVREVDVLTLLASSDPVDADALATRGATVRGLVVLEYLLFDPSGDDAAVVSTLDDRRCAYLIGLGDDAARSAQQLADAWDPAVGDLAGAFGVRDPWAGDALAMADLVNGLIGLTESVRIGKIGKPAGVYGTDAAPDTQTLESWRSRSSLAELQANIDGVAAVWGDEAVGLAPLVRALSPGVGASVTTAISDAQAALAAVPPPLDTAITASPDTVLAAYEATYALQRSIATELASVLGVTVTFTDNDGD